MTTYNVVDGPQTVTGGSGDDLLVYTHTQDGAGVSLINLSGSLATGYSGDFVGHAGAGVEFSGIERFRFTALGTGNDDIRTGDGDDTVSTGLGDDYIYSDEGVAVVDGGVGVDIWGADLLDVTGDVIIDLTAAGTQTFLGTSSVTEIEGFRIATGSGDDRLTATAFAVQDSIYTGDGADRIVIPIATDGVNDDTVTGAGGDDTLVFTHSFINGVMMTFEAPDNGYSGYINGHLSNNLQFFGIEKFNFTDLGGGADSILAGDARDTIDGGGGNDTLDSAGGSDIVDGGDGSDIWKADKSFATVAMKINLSKDAAQTYFGGGSVDNVEALQLKTGSGNDRLTGTSSILNDAIETGDGKDIIILPQAGSDTVNAGLGKDTLIVVYELAGGVAMAVGGTLASGYSGLFNGLASNDLSFSGVEHISFTNANEATGADIITTGDGNDTLSGGGGDDILESGKGNDVIDGGGGLDSWFADKSNTVAAIKIDLSKASPQAYLNGGSVIGIEAMRLKTGAGDDKLATRNVEMADTIESGAGDDRVTVRLVGGDSVNGGSGSDTLVVVNAINFDVTMTVTGSLGAGYNGVFDGFGAHNLSFSGIENISFTDLGAGANAIVTGDGNDTVSTGDNDDAIIAGGGRDVVRGGAGIDTITGGAGRDYLSGGGGGDRFIFNFTAESAVGSQRDLIAELGNGDLIDLEAIDANSVVAGNQTFAFIGGQGFHNVAGELRAVINGGLTIVSGDVDGDGAADFQIGIAGAPMVDGADFLL